jgi:hypothetical protein
VAPEGGVYLARQRFQQSDIAAGFAGLVSDLQQPDGTRIVRLVRARG